MPSTDRHWRWLLALALCLIIGPLLIYSDGALIGWGFAGVSPMDMFGAVRWPDLCGYVGLLLGGSTLITLARGAARRVRQRTLALAGEPDAMLLARSIPHSDATALPDLAHEPLELLWRTRRGTHGVIASGDGLVWRRPRKRDVLVRWGDARLLEVWFFAFGSDNGAGYALFNAAGKVAEWQDYREDKAPPAEDGASFAEMQRRQQTLLAHIAAHTGLQMRTFVLDLAQLPAALPSAPGARRGRLRRIWHWGTLFLLVLAGVPLFVAVGALTLPLTRSFPLNAYVAVTMGALGLFFLGFDLRIVTAPLHDKPSVPPPFVALPSVLPERLHLTPPLRLRGPSMLGPRIACLLIALLLAGDGYALIRSLIEIPLLNGDALFAPDDLRRVLIGALFLTVLVGLLLCGIGLFERRSVVILDETGVHWRRGRKRETLSWQLMTRLVAHLSKGNLESFSVAGADANETEISWSAKALWSLRPATISHADSDAAELAALVARRTGLALTIEDDA